MSDKPTFLGIVKSQEMSGINGPFEKISISLGPKDLSLLDANKNEKGWVNLLFKESAQGKKYLVIDTYVPVQKQEGFQADQYGKSAGENPYDAYRPGGQQEPPPRDDINNF